MGEGFEHRALMGATNLFSKQTPCLVFMEFHVTLLVAAGAAPPKHTVNFFQKHGYQLRSPTMSVVDQTIQAKGITELVWVHNTFSLGPENGKESCWNRCM